MKLVAVDTNVILDYELNRPRSDIFRTLIEQYQEGKIELLISLPVILELSWVAISVYHLSKHKVIEMLAAVLQLASGREPYRYFCLEALALFKVGSGTSYADCVIATATKNFNADELITQDRRLDKLFRSILK